MDFPLPKRLLEEGKAEKIIAYLSGRPSLTIEEEGVTIVLIEPTAPLISALDKEFMRGRVIYGLEAIGAILAQEEKGLKNRASRISRLIITSRDGSPRFYRNVGSLLKKYSPRLMALALNVDGSFLGVLCRRKKGRSVKALMVKRKEGVADLLSALIQ